jgi:flagellar FliL protein
MSEQAQAQPPAEGEEAAPEKPKPKGVVLIGALVGGLVVGVAAGLFAVGPMVAKKSGYDITALADSGPTAESHQPEGGAGGHGPEGEGSDAASSVHLIDNMVLNPAGSGGTRFVMLAAAVEFGDAKYVDQIRARDAEARDIVLRVVGSRGVEQLAEMSFREILRKELADSLSALFPKAERGSAIKRIFFPQFVIQ